MRALASRARRWLKHLGSGFGHVLERRTALVRAPQRGCATVEPQDGDDQTTRDAESDLGQDVGVQSASENREWRPLSKDVRVGDEVGGRVAMVEAAYILVDLNAGVPGIVFRDQLPANWAGRTRERAVVGDQVVAKVLSLNSNAGRLEFSLRSADELGAVTARASRGDWRGVQDKTEVRISPGLPPRHKPADVDGLGGVS